MNDHTTKNSTSPQKTKSARFPSWIFSLAFHRKLTPKLNRATWQINPLKAIKREVPTKYNMSTDNCRQCAVHYKSVDHPRLHGLLGQVVVPHRTDDFFELLHVAYLTVNRLVRIRRRKKYDIGLRSSDFCDQALARLRTNCSKTLLFCRLNTLRRSLVTLQAIDGVRILCWIKKHRD